MTRPNLAVAYTLKDKTTGDTVDGASVELRRGAAVVNLVGVGNGLYINDSVAVGEWQIWVDSVANGQSIAVGAGEPSAPDFSTNVGKILRAKADGYELVDEGVEEAPQDGNPYGRKDAGWVDLYTLLAKKNGDLAEAFNALSLTVANAVTASSILSTILDSNSATDLLLKRNGVTKVTVGATGTTFADDIQAVDGTFTGDVDAIDILANQNLTVNNELISNKSGNGAYVMRINTDNSWGLRQIGTGASSILSLQDLVSGKTFEVKDSGTGNAVQFTDGKVSAVKMNLSGLPTSSSGLSSGDVWNDSGTLKIV